MQEAIPDEEGPSARWYSHDCRGCRFRILHGCLMSFSFLILLRDPIDRPVYLGWHQTHKVLLGGGTKHRRTSPSLRRVSGLPWLHERLPTALLCAYHRLHI
jgi:hypothetical protein